MWIIYEMYRILFRLCSSHAFLENNKTISLNLIKVTVVLWAGGKGNTNVQIVVLLQTVFMSHQLPLPVVSVSYTHLDVYKRQR